MDRKCREKQTFQPPRWSCSCSIEESLCHRRSWLGTLSREISSEQPRVMSTNAAQHAGGEEVRGEMKKERRTYRKSKTPKTKRKHGTTYTGQEEAALVAPWKNPRSRGTRKRQTTWNLSSRESFIALTEQNANRRMRTAHCKEQMREYHTE